MKTKLISMVVACATAVLSASSVSAQDTGSFVLDRIKERGVINVGHRESSIPFSYIGPDGSPIGYSLDLCMEIIDQIKETVEVSDLEVNYVPVTGQTRIPLMANGTIDLECGSTTNNLTRSQQVDYLAVTFITGTKLAVRADAGINEIEDMAGMTIAVAQGTTNERAVNRVSEEASLGLRVMSVKDMSQGWLALETGRADAFATDSVLLFGLRSKAKSPNDFEVVGRFLSYDPYGIMVPRNDSTFRLIGNTVLANLMRSGEAQEIYNKWFAPGPTNINMPLSDTLSTAFEIQALPE
ncbi:MAG: amino acid ABC transporter substrate-binding protein [Roseovarius sp.]|nr:amino acid ABC transporter substrate-binding protein [Roseovarius sp.]